MKRIILISQGSQAIQLVRKLFGMGFKPEQIFTLTIDESKNNCFMEFLRYYNMLKNNSFIDSKNTLDSKLLYHIDDSDIVISFANRYKIDSTVNKKAKFINFHPGRLPYYKGSLSTVNSMINCEELVGGAWHYIADKMDSGNILYDFEFKIKDSDTAFSLNHKIFDAGINALDSVIERVNFGINGIKLADGGKFYYNKFPNIDNLSKDLQNRINYFPPNFKLEEKTK